MKRKLGMRCAYKTLILIRVDGRVSKKFWKELITYFPLKRHGLYRKRRLQQFFVAAETSLPSFYLVRIWGYTDRPTDSPLIRHGQHRNDVFSNSPIVACIRCRENVLTEPLPTNERRDTLYLAYA
jgi:hypothetical protein